MYIGDPTELMLPPKLVQDIDLSEPRDYHEFFWDEAVQRGQYAGPAGRAHTQVCRFDDQGDHVTMAKDCPHYEVEDEMGKHIPRGWTVQVNAQT
jgi:hypothetical protein